MATLVKTQNEEHTFGEVSGYWYVRLQHEGVWKDFLMTSNEIQRMSQRASKQPDAVPYLQKTPQKFTLGRYIMNLLISVDQFANTVAFGDYDETISSRIGKTKRKYGGRVPWRHPIQKVLDWFLEKVDKNHSIDAIEDDEGGHAFRR